MVQVEANDDTIGRHIVRRFEFVPARRQDCWVVVAAFDNKAECRAFARELALRPARRRAIAEPSDPHERVEQTYLAAGYHRQQQNGRLIMRAITRGAKLDRETWDWLANDLPSNVGVIRYEPERTGGPTREPGSVTTPPQASRPRSRAKPRTARRHLPVRALLPLTDAVLVFIRWLRR